MVKNNFLDSFRVVLDVKTFKAKKPIATSTLWLMGRTQGQDSEFFLDFDQPKESKGLRFLIRMRPDKGTFGIHVPSGHRQDPHPGSRRPPPSISAAPVLSMDDLQGFVPKGGETMALLKDEKVDHRDCYVVQVTLPRRWRPAALVDFKARVSRSENPAERCQGKSEAKLSRGSILQDRKGNRVSSGRRDYDT